MSKPNCKCFDKSYRDNCQVQPCKISDVNDFIKRHYLAKRPAIVLLALKMIYRGNPVGTIIFSAPNKQLSVRYGGLTWELARLYLLDEMPMNSESWLIAQGVKWIKRQNPEVGFLVSFADPSANHKGIIYQASGWTFDGKTDAGRKSPRCDYVDMNTGKKYGRKGNIPAGAVIKRTPRVSKYRYFLKIKESK